MTKYVNKTDALDAIKCQSGYMTDYTIGVSLEEIDDIFDELPTTDIIRCRDCQYYDKKYSWCNRYLNMHLQANEDGYCAWAEEKEE